jgi:GDPmannose 4,6-dehydratase
MKVQQRVRSGASMTGEVPLITGVTGEEGACLAEILLGKGCVVHGVKRRSSSFNTGSVDHLYHIIHRGRA